MPLDGHSYLVAQGWSGTGTGLRTGAISRPLAIPQKKNLAGLGKDRDEAFPFWDHLFTAAASAIKIKAADSDEDSDAGDVDQTTPAAPVLKRTSTGIISNRRPVVGTPASSASSGTSTPDAAPGSGSVNPRLSLMAIAKRQAAQRGLYSRFFRGPVLGPDDVDGEMVKSEIKADGAVTEVAELASGLGKGKGKIVDEGSGDEQIDEGKKEKKKREVGEVESKWDEDEERKRRKKELKEAEKRERRERKREKKAREATAADGPDGTREEKKEKRFRHDVGEERREARKRRKLERRNEQPPAPVDATSSSSLDPEDTPRMRKRKKHTGEEPTPVPDTAKESKKKKETGKA